MRLTGVQKHLVRHDDQCVPRQQSQRFAIGFMHAGAASAHIGVVKGRHIVMHQRRAVHHFDGYTSCLRQLWRLHATGMGYRHTKLGTYARPARKQGMPHRGDQTRWRGGA